jgi:3-phenylpropionate/cinnamic acid dioxygenase small subunit
MTTAVPPAPSAEVLGARVRVGQPLHSAILEWYDDEATLLDAGHTMDWVKLMAEDLLYRVPVRQNRLRDDPKSQFSDGMFQYDENFTTLAMKVMRLATTASPWAENPVSRTRRFVSNVKVYETPVADEYRVISSYLLTRSRYSEPVPLVLSGERRDLLRRDGDSFKVAERYVLLDQTTLGFPNLAVFL